LGKDTKYAYIIYVLGVFLLTNYFNRSKMFWVWTQRFGGSVSEQKITNVELRGRISFANFAIYKALRKKSQELGFRIKVRVLLKGEPAVVVGDCEFPVSTPKTYGSLMRSFDRWRHLFPKGTQ